MNIELLNVSKAELKDGYCYNKEDKVYRCIFCGQLYTKGEIYKIDDRFADAGRAIELHILDNHDSAFDALIAEDKKVTGMTDVQKELMIHFHSGISDKEIAERTDTAPSTIRYQRHNLREKAKQAKVFLALFELMEEKSKGGDIKVHSGATMVDERYMVTDEESGKIIESFFLSVDPLVLKCFSSKEKKKLVLLNIISKQFVKGEKYSEKQVNEILEPIYHDYATIRRYLIEYGFMERTKDCKEYWLK